MYSSASYWISQRCLVRDRDSVINCNKLVTVINTDALSSLCIFISLFIFVTAALSDYVIVASIIIITIRNYINCAALPFIIFMNVSSMLTSQILHMQMSYILIIHV